MKSRKLQSAIMRRVYYSYALSIVTHIMFLQGVFLGMAAFLLARWLHVASIVQNFLSVPVGSVPQYVFGSFYGAVTHGEVLTVLVLVAASVVAVSAGYHVAQAVLGRVSFILRV